MHECLQMALEQNRWQKVDLDYKGCSAEVSYSLDARGSGSRCYYWALFLELDAARSFRSFAGRYLMGTFMVGHEVYP